MLRVMLVDDEALALEGLRLLIDWQAEGFSICAECSSASQALLAIPAALPDLIVTDIRMPGMDGLQLMELARENGFRGEFVVVSGYGDFDYAQRALQIGVSGYLLKPIESSEAAEVLEHVRDRLITREAIRIGRRTKTQQALALVLSGQTSAIDELPAGHCWRLATWGAPLPYEIVSTLLASFPDGIASSHIIEDKEFLVLQWPTSGPEPFLDTSTAILTNHHRKVMISGVCTSADQLPLQLDALMKRIEGISAYLPERIDALVKAIALRDMQACITQSANLERLCSACGTNTRACVRARLFSECASLLAIKPAMLQAFIEAQPNTIETISLEAIHRLAPEHSHISRRAIAWMEERLVERISLETVAEALGYNATYLGRVFREEQGLGFREWLNQRRIVYAADLLCSSDDALYAIAEQSGFKHYKRFLEHFKRHYGMPPDQYRRERKQR